MITRRKGLHAVGLLLGPGLATAVAATALLGQTAVRAATITVPCTHTNATDVAALNAAISGASSGDTITLTAGCTFTLSTVNNSIAGSTGTPAITATLTIEGNGDTITRSTAPATPSFRLFIATTGTLTVDNLVLTNGAGGDGGAIFSQGGGLLTVTNSTISGNSGGDGGGIASEGESGSAGLVVIGSTITGNTASTDGGGLHIDNAATVINSTITGNTAPKGGGVYNNGGSPVLINDTIDANTASTAGMGGGVNATQAAVAFKNTIDADNTGGNCASGSIVTDNGHNLENGTTCAFSSNAVNGEPQLGALASNGGPTQTQAITSSSPAYHAADAPTCALAQPGGAGGVDQRGDSRFSPAGDGVCDIGAFAVQAAVTTPTPTALPVPPTGADAVAPSTGGLVATVFGATLIGLVATGLVYGERRRRRLR